MQMKPQGWFITQGHAIAQAVSCWLLTMVAQVQSQVHVGYVIDRVTLEQVFSECISFVFPILFPPNTPFISCIIWNWYSEPFMA
jgi:hypothetical protein